MCDIDLYPCTVWREQSHKARKEHRCDGCGAKIGAGEQYLSHFSVFEGDASSQACCAACRCARAEFADEHGQLFAPSMLRDMLHECIADGDEDSERKWKPMLAALDARKPAP